MDDIFKKKIKDKKANKFSETLKMNHLWTISNIIVG
jgi:hypothetical protein